MMRRDVDNSRSAEGLPGVRGHSPPAPIVSTPSVAAVEPMPAPVLTFAIPFYSGAAAGDVTARAYLERTIASVVAQRDPRWVAYVCDNASPDRSVAQLVARAGGGRVGYVRNERNL